MNIAFKALLELWVPRWRGGLGEITHPVRQIVHQLRIGPHNPKRDDLQGDKGNHPAIHLNRSDDSRGHPAQVEERKAERRGQERGLNIQANHHPKPDSGDVSARIRQQNWRNDRHHNHGDLDEVEEEAEDKDHQPSR